MSGRQSPATFSSSHSRRSRQEAALVRRRNAEYDRQQLWNGVTRYFHTWDVQSSKHSDWASPRYYSQRFAFVSCTQDHLMFVPHSCNLHQFITNECPCRNHIGYDRCMMQE
jgi:hypothetical protein